MKTACLLYPLLAIAFLAAGCPAANCSGSMRSAGRFDWNAGLPCSGLITSIHSHGQIVTATFRLADRPKSRCDGPGKRVTAIFRVVDGKIVLWHQTVREGPEGPSV